MSAPAAASLLISATQASMLWVYPAVMVCTATGAGCVPFRPPPILTMPVRLLPSVICRVERRGVMTGDSTGLQSKQLQTASQRERFCGYRQEGNIFYQL